MLKNLVVFAFLIGVASTVKCLRCNSWTDCQHPEKIECGANVRCFTRSKNGNPNAKGCDYSCPWTGNVAFLSTLTKWFYTYDDCTVCNHREYCNDGEYDHHVNTFLRCLSCDNNSTSCENPHSVRCEPNSKCYTQIKGNRAIRKGCARPHDAVLFSVGFTVTTCHDHFDCNGPEFENSENDMKAHHDENNNDTETVLKCFSCDNYISCGQPKLINCPQHSECYSLEINGHTIAKGCGQSCNEVTNSSSVSCTTCHYRFCNRGFGVTMEGDIIYRDKIIGNVNKEYYTASSSYTFFAFTIALSIAIVTSDLILFSI